ncbi:unnamed protein product [Mycena citricolor]|uniref:Condensation domain-containing protein n=1 Tax=Mycena citricolor TaxID=2018698 RepID=A0AAD2GR03_9AGAR|nr:unnamed protein product [Mycena citricolor]
MSTASHPDGRELASRSRLMDRTQLVYRRELSPNELSYFLQSRATGLNDVFTSIAFRAPSTLMSPVRLSIVWAIMRQRHSLLACSVEMPRGNYDDAHFVYMPPPTHVTAIEQASQTIFLHDKKLGHELMDDCLNGPRLLSLSRLSRLDITRQSVGRGELFEYHLFLSSHHMIGGAIPVFQLINDMFELLAVQTDAELESLLRREWIDRWGHVAPKEAIMPSTETLLSVSKASRLRRHALRVDHDNVQRRYVGGHVFPRAPQAKTPPKPAQRTQTRQLQAKFSREQTIAIRAACKAHGVSIGNAFFALCNIAWLRLMAAHPEYRQCAPKELPMLLYSVVNLEHILPPCQQPRLGLALEYLSVCLPGFLHSDPMCLFWHRAKEAHRQVGAYVRSPLLPGRALATSEMRAERAKGWARFDDAIAQGSKAPPPPASPATGAGAPSLALMGLSQQGSVDALFRTERYPAIELLDLVGGSRRGTGGVLLSTRTFLGRFGIWLNWDAGTVPNGGEIGLMDEFWRLVVDGVHELVLGDERLLGTAEEVDSLKGTLTGTHTFRAKL